MDDLKGRDRDRSSNRVDDRQDSKRLRGDDDRGFDQRRNDDRDRTDTSTYREERRTDPPRKDQRDRVVIDQDSYTRVEPLCKDALTGTACMSENCSLGHPSSLSKRAFDHAWVWFRNIREKELSFDEVNEHLKEFHVARNTWDESKAKNPSDTDDWKP